MNSIKQVLLTGLAALVLTTSAIGCKGRMDSRYNQAKCQTTLAEVQKEAETNEYTAKLLGLASEKRNLCDTKDQYGRTGTNFLGLPIEGYHNSQAYEDDSTLRTISDNGRKSKCRHLRRLAGKAAEKNSDKMMLEILAVNDCSDSEMSIMETYVGKDKE